MSSDSDTPVAPTIEAFFTDLLTKAKRAPMDDPFRTFDEWNSDADRRAYAKL